MAQILIKRSSVAAKVPLTSNLALGELSINTNDGKLFMKKNNGADSIVEVGFTAFSGDLTGSGNDLVNLTLVSSGVVAGTYTKVIVDSKGRVTTGAALSSTDVTTALGFTPTNNAASGTAGGTATLDANGKLTASQIPTIAITDTFVVATETAMLALSTADIGDIAVRTDLSKSYILTQLPYSSIANWQELLSPTDVVTSVAGRTGTVTLSQSDIGGLLTTSSPAFAAVTATTFTGALVGNATTATNAGNVTGVVSIANGGTGSITAPLAVAALGAVAKAGDSMTGLLAMSTSPIVAATGTTQATSKALTSQINVITTSTAGSAIGVALPSASPGLVITIINTTSNALTVYPFSGCAIDSLGANIGYTLGANGRIQFVAISTAQYYSLTAVYA